MRVTLHTGSAWRIWGILKKVSWVESCLGRRRLTFACSLRPDEFTRYGRCTIWWWWWGGWLKNQNRKNVYLSPYVEEPLNLKVIKSFVPELRSRKGFSYFGIPMFYVFLCIYVRNNLCTFHTYPYLASVQ